jgi:hypothetical protein
MKTRDCLLVAGLVPPLFLSLLRQEPPAPGQDPSAGDNGLITNRGRAEAERLTREIEGSWMLLDFRDPNEEAFSEDSLDGFATFHEGFLTLVIEADALQRKIFRARDYLFVQAGAYRYRIDERGSLQTSSVMSFSNTTADGNLLPEPSGTVGEYILRIEEGDLELRTSRGTSMTFRRVKAGDFPESALRKIERQRGGVEVWHDPRERDG